MLKPKKKKNDEINKLYKDNLNYINLKDNILKYQNTVYNPNYETSSIKNKLNTNSCFNIDIFNDNKNINIPLLKDNLFIENNVKELTICDKINLKLNKEQKHILKVWFNSNDLMYNETIKFLKDNYILMKNEFNNNENIQKYIKLYNEIYFLKKIQDDNNDFLKKNNNLLKKYNDSLKKYNDSLKKNKKNKIDILKKNIIIDIKIYFLKKNKIIIDKIDILKKNIIIDIKIYFLNINYLTEKNIVNAFLKNKPYCISYNKFKLNYQNIRTYFLKEKRNIIIKNCNSNILNKDIKIKTHILDATIKIACANYQSSISNYENGNIKHFRIRYWKDKRDKRVLEIEKCYFTKGSLCPLIFNSIKGFIIKNGKNIIYDFNNINSTVKLHFNKKTDEYVIFLSKDIKCIDNNDSLKKNLIGIDLGLRTFASCLSENQTIDICKTNDTKINKLIKIKIECYKKIKIINSKKNKNKLSKVNKRIKGFIDELHWKTINFLTSNYKNILIGDLSTKGIVCNNNSVLTPENKELAYAYSFYTFRQRLEYKCISKKCNYKKVEEWYTSKTCSYCSGYNENLGGNKVFNCSFCKSKFDRDINSCRNIIIKCL